MSDRKGGRRRDGVAPRDRKAVLNRTRALKMARSVHAYVRGNTAHFYEWLLASPVAAAIPAGPPVWICGDCHLGNLGPLADADRHIAVQIRDLDQTVVGNPALDLIRLGLSLETAARSSDLPGVVTAKMIAAMLDGYVGAITPRIDDDPAEPNVVRAVRRRAAGRHWRHLARERIGGDDPGIPLGKNFWELTTRERRAIDTLFDQPAIRDRALALASAGIESGRIRVVDAAYWRKGCSSLGRLRYAVLLGIKAKGGDERLALVDIKEAVPSVAPADPAVTMPGHAGERVVAGACALSPHLGERMIAADLLGRPVVLRELAPQDLKIEVETFSRGQAIAAAAYLAAVVGRGHARQLSNAKRLAWAKRLTPQADGTPSWLWRSIVDLAGRHEAGYLDHCRRFALEAADA